MIIYKITNKINGKIYVGQTIKTLKRRLQQHFANSKKSNTYLCKAIRKHGKENFNIELLEECTSLKKLNKRESYWIKRLDSKNNIIGYNLTNGGDGTIGHTHTKNAKQKMSIAKKGKTYEELYGKENAEYMRKQRSIESTGRIVKKETRIKISKQLKNKSYEDIYGILGAIKQKKKLSDARKKIIYSVEHKQNLSISHQGKLNAMYGKRHSEETKKKISLKRKLYFERKRNEGK